MGIEIISPGLFTSVQDLGRKNYQKYGVTVSGALDRRALSIGNILVGNKESETSLETTIIGPNIKFNSEIIIAITGADMGPKLNNKKIDNYRAILVKEGDILSFTGLVKGQRGYIAFNGGLNIKKIMGSSSTSVIAGFGGLDGRKLKAGDILRFNNSKTIPEQINIRKFKEDYYDEIGTRKIRVIEGPQIKMFKEDSINLFFNSEYIITNDFNRMGCRLEGKRIETISGSDIISDGIALGAIQVPKSGKPIIMLSERQTTGGYAKIAYVSSVDIPKIAQLSPGNKIKFEIITVEDSQKLVLKEKELFNNLKIEINRYILEDVEKRFLVKIKDRKFDVSIKELNVFK